MPAAATHSLPAALAQRLDALAEARAGLLQELDGPDGLDRGATTTRAADVLLLTMRAAVLPLAARAATSRLGS